MWYGISVVGWVVSLRFCLQTHQFTKLNDQCIHDTTVSTFRFNVTLSSSLFIVTIAGSSTRL